MGKKSKDTVLTPEWSHKVDSGTIDSKITKHHIVASDEECKDLARRLRIISVTGLEADMTMQRVPDRNIIHVTGRLKAQVTQSCVITNEPVTEAIEEIFESWHDDEEQVISLDKAKRDRLSMMVDSELPMPDDQDDPEPVIDGQIDLGELATQHLSLAITPYPRAVGATHSQTDEGNWQVLAGGATERPNPFAALKDWKLKKESEK